MATTAPTGPSESVLVFERGGDHGGVIPIAFVGVVCLTIILIGVSAAQSMPGNGGFVVGCLLVVFMAFSIASRQFIVEFDLRARTLKITRRSFGRWTKTIVHCPFDECHRLGRIVYTGAEGELSYGVYVELSDGTRHAVPLKRSTLLETGLVASELSNATGIQRQDTSY
jgi:hypothetical protein